jgi:hypothetical protein
MTSVEGIAPHAKQLKMTASNRLGQFLNVFQIGQSATTRSARIKLPLAW